jgi:protein SCO1/2
VVGIKKNKVRIKNRSFLIHTSCFLLRVSGFLLFFVILGWIPTPAKAAEPLPYELEGVGVEEHLGRQIPLNLEFKDETGQVVSLKKYFDGKPVLLTLVYYECPNLCNFLLNGLVESLKQMPWTVGDQFNIISLSIDPNEGPELAEKKKKAYLNSYGRPQAASGWHFLTGSEAPIKELADTVGFKYKYDADQKQFAHTAVVFVITPDGKLSRYLPGIQFFPRDVKLSLLEATEGKIGNVVDRFLMFCYHYDPKGKKYALMATNLMKLGGGITVAGLALLLIVLGRGKKSKARRWKPDVGSRNLKLEIKSTE